MVWPRSCRVIYYFNTPAFGRRHQSFGRVMQRGNELWQLSIIQQKGNKLTYYFLCILNFSYCYLFSHYFGILLWLGLYIQVKNLSWITRKDISKYWYILTRKELFIIHKSILGPNKDDLGERITWCAEFQQYLEPAFRFIRINLIFYLRKISKSFRCQNEDPKLHEQ